MAGSRQSEWQKKMRQEGNCAMCGKPRNLYAWRCDACQKKLRESVRKAVGGRKWEPGSPGRPPKWVVMV